MSGRTVVIVYDDGSRFAMTSRWRKPGGRVVHAASVSAPDERSGRYVICLCDDRMVQWLAHTELERLDLLQPDDAEVTCKACRTEIDRVLRAALPIADGGET